MNQEHWSDRYRKGNTGWDIGYVSTPIKEFADSLEDKDIRILVPGAGNGYEVEYLHQMGFSRVYVLDIAPEPLENLMERVPEFPEDRLIRSDFFDYGAATYDLIIEQTFFCALPPERRPDYARHMHELLAESGLLAGLWFNFPLDLHGGPPYGGDEQEYMSYLLPWFEVRQWGIALNSIPPRLGREYFGLFQKK